MKVIIIIIVLIGSIVIVNYAYKKGFDAGVKWERDILLEYDLLGSTPDISCDEGCALI